MADSTINDILPSIPIRDVIVDSSTAKCLEELGYEKLSAIQAKAFKYITLNYTTIIVAPTGSGKTEAALIPVMNILSMKKAKPISVIYVTPLRALNRDLELRIGRLSTCFELRVAVRHGDTPVSLRKKIKESPPHILLTTPESFQYIVADEIYRKYLSNLHYVVIDEFREMISSKRGMELLSAINIVERIIGRRLVKVCLTASLTNVLKAIELIDSPTYVQVIESSASKSAHISIETPGKIVAERNGQELEIWLGKLVEGQRHAIIFTNTRDTAENIAWHLSNLSKLYGRVSVHHGSLSKESRVSTEKAFREGKLKAVVATSSLELGIDVGHIDYVIQYMSPRQAVRLMQRIGRSVHRITGVSRGAIVTTRNFYDILESIVLAGRTLMGILEKEEIPDKPLDVLAHQVALRVMMSPGIRKADLYVEFHSSRVFHGLDLDSFNEVLGFLEELKVIRVINEEIYPGRRLKQYFYRVTMIPEVKVANVVELSTGKVIGSLNEEFIVTSLEENATFILAGSLWRFIGYDRERGKLYVEPVEESFKALIPRWEGESIPVEHSVARHAGAFVRMAIKEGLAEALKRFGLSNVYISSESREYIEEVLKELKKNNITPTDNTIVVELMKDPGVIVLYGFFGSKVANLLKEIALSVVRRTITPNSHGYATPYYIILEFEDVRPTMNQVNELIKELSSVAKSSDYEDLIKRVIENSSAYLWRTFFVAQRFGVIDPESRVKVTKSMLQRLSKTIIGKEALKETLLRDYDVADTVKLLKDLGRLINVKTILWTPEREYTLFREAISRLLSKPVKYYSIDLSAYKSRLLRRRVSLLCLHCGYIWRMKVEEVINSKNIICKKCNATLVAVIKGDGAREQGVFTKLRNRSRLCKKERRIMDGLMLRAMLTSRYGSIVSLIIAGRGVGNREAIKILNEAKSEEDAIRMIYDVEKRFVKIMKYIPKVSGAS
ncbi:MAG: DEAD/DEAH box helicase [Sulfolobales archaeon]|nr:DEAD/DEAH box helicase [Sulfolobales archaeon]